MVNGILFIVLLVIIIGGIILMIAVNFILSIIRRIRHGKYADDDYFDTEDNVRRHSNQYHFRGTTTSYSNTNRRTTQNESQQSFRNPNSAEPEIIVDTRDANVANRQIISDDEGEYVDFVEEK
ncbi:MAG: DUF4834 family protein [Prevotella sp.]